MTLTRGLEAGDGTTSIPDAPGDPTEESAEYVVLVDADGRPSGRELKSVVHTATTARHLAFSLHLFVGEPLAPGSSVLLTRRALDKKTWPGVWTNSCCGHPGPGESAESAVRRRVQDELGVAPDAWTGLRCVLPDFAYRATDASGIVENEVCPVYVAELAPGVHPDQVVAANPAEVAEWAWVEWSAATASIVNTPFAFSPWAVGQVEDLIAGSGPSTAPTGGSGSTATPRSPLRGQRG
ncbi:isopentenyl-diphosphate delta-isomerase [Friedmanniella endophytica]|uniref:Isopentenyl-diphosphate Delta-isomerase n=1 Tax=Microlunatus kandeliicorticis TaxID=1759536 RepID=A0A7W3ITB7_9ACTN|nr:isopentenyl-diphosphate delta-isomerase [Microlunatus kandeliicorticis]